MNLLHLCQDDFDHYKIDVFDHKNQRKHDFQFQNQTHHYESQ